MGPGLDGSRAGKRSGSFGINGLRSFVWNVRWILYMSGRSSLYEDVSGVALMMGKGQMNRG